MNYKQNAFDTLNEIAPIFSNIFNDVIHQTHQAKHNNGFKIPLANIVEIDNGYEMHISLPGFSKDEINLKIEDHLLEITAEKPAVDNAPNVKYLRKEMELSKFKRSFNLSDKIDKSKINASFNNGILVVSLLKKENVSFKINVD